MLEILLDFPFWRDFLLCRILQACLYPKLAPATFYTHMCHVVKLSFSLACLKLFEKWHLVSFLTVQGQRHRIYRHTMFTFCRSLILWRNCRVGTTINFHYMDPCNITLKNILLKFCNKYMMPLILQEQVWPFRKMVQNHTLSTEILSYMLLHNLRSKRQSTQAVRAPADTPCSMHHFWPFFCIKSRKNCIAGLEMSYTYTCDTHIPLLLPNSASRYH